MKICFDTCYLTEAFANKDWKEKTFVDAKQGKVKVLFSNGTYKDEVEKIEKAKAFFVELARQSRIIKIDDDRLNDELAEFSTLEGRNCSFCDDPHIFALMSAAEGDYLFTNDTRLLKCKQRIKKDKKSRRFVKFKTIRTEQVYKHHRQRIISM